MVGDLSYYDRWRFVLAFYFIFILFLFLFWEGWLCISMASWYGTGVCAGSFGGCCCFFGRDYVCFISITTRMGYNWLDSLVLSFLCRFFIYIPLDGVILFFFFYWFLLHPFILLSRLVRVP